MSRNGSSGGSTRIVETPMAGETVVGEHFFDLNGHAPRNNFLDYFYFVDSNGDPVDASGGTVTLELAPVLPLYQVVSDGTFNAVTARDASWVKPNGFGKAVSARITFAGIIGAPVGFRALLTQSVS